MPNSPKNTASTGTASSRNGKAPDDTNGRIYTGELPPDHPDYNPFDNRRAAERTPATRINGDHAATLLVPSVGDPQREALASMADWVIDVKDLIARKVINPDDVPTVDEADHWAGKRDRAAPSATITPPKGSDAAKVRVASRLTLDLALKHGLSPLAEFAVSDLVAATGMPWTAAVVEWLRNAATANRGRKYAKQGTWKVPAMTLAGPNFRAPVADLLRLPVLESFPGDPRATAAEAESVRLIERWAAEDWKVARDGDGGDIDIPKMWRATDMAASQPLEWLVLDTVPKAAVTLLIGDEGIGKSAWWVWLVYHVTTGKGFEKYGIPARDPADVVLIITEDDWSTTVRPRLEVQGVDLSRVHVMAAEPDGSGTPVFPTHMDVLKACGIDVALVIVDAWADTLPPKLSVRDAQQARQALHPWKEFVAASRAAVILLTHTNRIATDNPRDMYGLTAELRKKARMTLFAFADPEHPGGLLIGPEKSNITRSDTLTRFQLSSAQHSIPTDESSGQVVRADYVSGTDLTARSIIFDAYHGTGDDDNADDFDLVEGWLHDYLELHGETESRIVKNAARAAGVIGAGNPGENMLRRAAKAVRVEFGRTSTVPSVGTWALKGAVVLSAEGDVVPSVVLPDPEPLVEAAIRLRGYVDRFPEQGVTRGDLVANVDPDPWTAAQHDSARVWKQKVDETVDAAMRYQLIETLSGTPGGARYIPAGGTAESAREMALADTAARTDES